MQTRQRSVAGVCCCRTQRQPVSCAGPARSQAGAPHQLLHRAAGVRGCGLACRRHGQACRWAVAAAHASGAPAATGGKIEGVPEGKGSLIIKRRWHHGSCHSTEASAGPAPAAPALDVHLADLASRVRDALCGLRVPARQQQAHVCRGGMERGGERLSRGQHSAPAAGANRSPAGNHGGTAWGGGATATAMQAVARGGTAPQHPPASNSAGSNEGLKRLRATPSRPTRNLV